MKSRTLQIVKRFSYRWSGIAPAVLGLAAALFASLANAQNTLPTNVLTSPSDVSAVFCGALLWLFWGLIVLGIAMFLVGGYTYATAAGDAEKVSKATKTITYAAIALVIALLAKGVPNIVGSLLGAQTVTVCGS